MLVGRPKTPGGPRLTTKDKSVGDENTISLSGRPQHSTVHKPSERSIASMDGKTPHTSQGHGTQKSVRRRRRALGDISNRKVPPGSILPPRPGSPLAKTAVKASLRRATTTSTATAGPNKTVSFSSPTLLRESSEKVPPTDSSHGERVSSEALKIQVDAEPERLLSLKFEAQLSLVPSSRPVSVQPVTDQKEVTQDDDDDSVEDIERPAGRTWSQEQAWLEAKGLLNDDDIKQELQAEGVWNLREEWQQCLQKMMENDRACLDEDQARADQEFEQMVAQYWTLSEPEVPLATFEGVFDSCWEPVMDDDDDDDEQYQDVGRHVIDLSF